MSGEPTNIGDAQRWLLAAITSAQSPGEQQTQHWLTAGPHQSPAERLSIYRHAYVARLLEVVRELFPCTRFAAGDDLFDQLMVNYLRHWPPQSYTLARLADRLVEHLEATRPPDWGAFLVELARLEQTIDRVFDAPGGEQLPPFVLPADVSGPLYLRLTPGLQLLACDYPVSTFYTAWKQGRAPQWPDPQSEYLALVRRDYIVRRYELTSGQFALLSALATGRSLDDALASLAVHNQDPSDLAQRVQKWFAFWATERFFAAAQSSSTNEEPVKSPQVH